MEIIFLVFREVNFFDKKVRVLLLLSFKLIEMRSFFIFVLGKNGNC